MGFVWVLAGMVFAPVAAMAVLVLVRLVSGAIPMDGLLRCKTDGAGSPGRLQFLIAAMAAAAGFLLSIVDTSLQPMAAYGFPAMPDPSTWVEGGLGASGGVYLLAKGFAALRDGRPLNTLFAGGDR